MSDIIEDMKKESVGHQAELDASTLRPFPVQHNDSEEKKDPCVDR